MKPGRILCPVDFSEATDSGLTPALSLATELGAELLLLHVLNVPYPQIGRTASTFDIDAYYLQMEQQAAAHLSDLVDSDSARLVNPTVLVRRGVPHHEIVEVATGNSVGLIVMPTHGRHGLQRWVFGSTAEKVVRLAACPVLTVSPRLEPEPFQPAKILLVTDFSGHADRALTEALSLACQYDAELTLLHVATMWENDPANPAWQLPAVPDAYRSSVLDVAQEQLDGCKQRCEAHGVDVKTLLVRGFDPATEIVRTAADDLATDLIVMGTHGHTGLAHALLGSVAAKVVRGFDGFVLTVRSAPA